MDLIILPVAFEYLERGKGKTEVGIGGLDSFCCLGAGGENSDKKSALPPSLDRS